MNFYEEICELDKTNRWNQSYQVIMLLLFH